MEHVLLKNEESVARLLLVLKPGGFLLCVRKHKPNKWFQNVINEDSLSLVVVYCTYSGERSKGNLGFILYV